MGVALKLSELAEECRKRGVVVNVSKGKSPGKRDYVNALQTYSLEELRKIGKLSAGVKWIHTNLQETPMLAISSTQIKTERYEEILASEDYIAEEKINGCRVILVYYPDEGLHIFSRGRSVIDFLFIDYIDQIVGYEGLTGVFNRPFVLDGEIISVEPNFRGRVIADTCLQAVTQVLAMKREDSWGAQLAAGCPIRIMVWDCLMYDDHSLLDLTLRERKVMLSKVMTAIHSKYSTYTFEYKPKGGEVCTFNPYANIIEVPYIKGGAEVKAEAFNKLVLEGKEGLVLKDLNAAYNSTETRTAGRKLPPYVKMKATVSRTLALKGIAQDLDAFVSGFFLSGEDTRRAGKVGGLKFSVYLTPSGEVHQIGAVGSLTEAFLDEITVVVDEIPADVPDYRYIARKDGRWVSIPASLYGKVAVLEGQSITARAKAFQHCRLVEWHETKTALDCVFSETLLDELIP